MLLVDVDPATEKEILVSVTESSSSFSPNLMDSTNLIRYLLLSSCKFLMNMCLNEFNDFFL